MVQVGTIDEGGCEGIQPLHEKEKCGFQSPFPLVEEGTVTSPKGFRAAGVHAGFRRNPERLDFGVVVADEPVAAAGVFTQNIFCAAPVCVSKAHLEDSGGCARAIIINSGNANAATGSVGMENAGVSAELAAEVFGCTAEEVLVASTGVIGIQLPMEPFDDGLREACRRLSVEGGHDAAMAIMTTDTHPKEFAVRFSGDGIGFDGVQFTVGGIAKGSGMIMPNMATMISVLTTDAPIRSDALQQALRNAVGCSFNKVTVDSDTSTNDTCFLMASGAAVPAGSGFFELGSPAFDRFQEALCAVCIMLARSMATDGEGATRLVTVRVSGAVDQDDADVAARTIANSPLVKTAIYGHDANWGRIAGAVGRSGAKFAQEQVAIDIMGLPVCRDGMTVFFDEDEALRRFEEPEITIDVDLGAGNADTTIWTCDFSHEYVTINGDYRT